MTSTIASSSSIPRWASRANGAALAPVPPSSRSPARSPAIRRATRMSQTPPTTACRCSAPAAPTCARSAPPRARARPSWRPAASPSIPPAGCWWRTTDNNRISSFAQGGGAFLGALTRAGGYRAGFAEPGGVAIDPRGSVYIADTGATRVVRLWGEGTYLSELGGPANLGGAGLSGAGSAAVSASSGDLYVADTGHNRVLVYSPTGALLARVGAGGGSGAPGKRAGRLTTARPPSRLAPSGYVFVADTANNRIVKLRPDGSLVGQFGVIGSGEGRLHSPTGVAVDAGGRVYVVDGFNNRIEVFDEAGHYLARWGLRGVGLGYLSQPTGVAVGCEGSVFVADTNNNRIERFDPAAPAGVGCVAASAWPPPLDVAPRAAREPAPAHRHPRAARPGAHRQLRTGLSRARHRDAVTALPAPPSGARRERPPAGSDAERTRAPARRLGRPAPPAPSPRTSQRDGRARAHRRGRSHRAAHCRYPNLLSSAIMLV